MKISLLEKDTLTIGDVDLSLFSALCECDYYGKLTKDEIIEKCGVSDVIICNKTIFDRELISSLPGLRLICVSATGYNNIDVSYAKEKGIAVCNVPGYSSESVVQTVFALMLSLSSSISEYSSSVKNGDWIKSENFTYFPYRITELSGKTLGIVGFGNIGRRVADVASALGMKVIFSAKHDKKSERFEQVSLDELFARSDVISLNCPLTDETKYLINKDSIGRMKKSVLIVNTARGPVVCEKEVAQALREGRISGYAADVLETEPMSENCPLIGAPNTILTPHIAWASRESRERLISAIFENIKAFINGKTVNQVNL